jgi:ankyrin repeat protein
MKGLAACLLLIISIEAYWGDGLSYAKDPIRQQSSQPNLNIQLLQAIKSPPKKGGLERVKNLLKQGANPNATIPGEAPFLAYALCSKNIKLVNLLLDHGTNPSSNVLLLQVCNTQLSQQFIDLVVGSLVVHGASLNALPNPRYSSYGVLQEDDNPPLYKAIQAKNIVVVRSLLKNGANPNDIGGYATTPLELAIETGFEMARDVLLDHPRIQIRAETFQRAIERGRSSELVHLLMKKEGNPRQLNYAHETPLMMAAERGHVEILHLLLNEGKVDINQQGEHCETALVHAARYGHVGAVMFLLAHGADINIPCGGEFEYSPLGWALYEEHPEIASLLLDAGASVAEKATGHDKALPLAAWHGYVDVVNRMLSMGAPVDAKQGKERATALMLAAYRGRLDIVKTLVEKGAAVNEFSYAECDGLACDTPDTIPFYGTPLMWATRKGHIEIVRYLLDHGGDPDLLNILHDTAYSLALKLGHEELFQLLLSHASEIRRGTGQAADLFYSAAALDRIDVMEYLLNRGVDVNAPSSFQHPPLIAACLAGQANAVRFLIERGANVNTYGQGEKTPMTAVIRYGMGSPVRESDAEIVELLIKAGADVNRSYYEGLTVLSMAVSKNQGKVVQLLLAAGADPNVPGDIQDAAITVLMAAARAGSLEIVKALIQASADVVKDGPRAIQLAKLNSHDEVAQFLELELKQRR